MSKRFVLLITSVLVAGFVLSPGIAGAPPVAPGEFCTSTTDGEGLELEICGAKPAGGSGPLSQHVGECRIGILDTGSPTTDDEEAATDARAVVATAITTCHFFKVLTGGGLEQWGPNQKLATPGTATQFAQNFGMDFQVTSCVKLEGFALLTTTDEITVSTLGDEEPCKQV